MFGLKGKLAFSSARCAKNKLYESGFTWKDHRDLAQLLASIQGKAMVLNSQNERIHELYTGLGFAYKVVRTKYSSRKSDVGEDGSRVRPVVPLYVYMNF